MNTVLVIASHPDDEVLGAGGTLAKHVRAGDEVHAVVLSEGATSRYEEGMANALRRAAESSAEVMGFSSIHFRDFPDQRLDQTPLIDVTQALEPLIQKFKPSTIYTHTPSDVNVDHGVVARAAWTACRPYTTPWLERFACFETPSSTEWGWPGLAASFEPQHFVDITDTLDIKISAMACYESELRAYPHPRSPQALRERAAYWGSRVNREAAEPFVILRSMA